MHVASWEFIDFEWNEQEKCNERIRARKEKKMKEKKNSDICFETKINMKNVSHTLSLSIIPKKVKRRKTTLTSSQDGSLVSPF